MASAFNLTAQINLRGPSNLKPIVAQIKREIGSVSANVKVTLDNTSAKSIDNVTNRLQTMNSVLVQTKSHVSDLNNAFRTLSSSLTTIKSAGNATSNAITKTSQSVRQTSQNIKVARTEMEEFGRQAFLATKRFAAFTLVTTGIFALTNAVTSGFKAFITFNKELIRLQQVTGKGSIGISGLEKEITRLATSLGVSSESLTTVATTLAQAGLSAEDTRIALAALAKTELAPSFDDLVSTTEGAIAALRQFGLQTKDLEAALGSINAVAAAFAVESSDIITAIQRTGGVFASASKGVSEGKDALNEFIAVFTSVRATTRESAETIATGLRTIFTRVQRAKTIEQLKQFGVELQDLEGKFVGPFEAVRRLSEALNQLDPRDVRFSSIVEELGGFRQIGKVIPLIQQFATAQQALGVAQKGQNSLTDAQIIAQQSLANQIAKVREQFLALIRDIGKSTVFQGLFKVVLGLASGLISLASAFKPILPILAIFGAIKGVSALTQFGGGFLGGFKKSGGGGAKGAGENIAASISGAKEKERAEATSRAADAIRLNTDALKSLTTVVQSLDSTIKSRGSATLSSGGRVYGFQSGGIVPGSGRGDKVPALLEPGEIVMNRNAVNKYGAGNLVEMNKSRSTKGIARGARSRLKELSPEELSQLSTEDMIKYAKAQAREIFSTGGSGMATSSKFIPVSQERITPELESSLTSYLGQKGFWKEVVSPFGKPSKSVAKAQSKLSREQALQQQTARMADEVAARGQQWTSIKNGSAIDNYLLGTLKDPILSDYRTVRGGGSLPKAFHDTRLRKAVNEALDAYDDFDYSAGNIDKLVSNFAAKRFAVGGIVQKLKEGGISKELQKQMIEAGGYEKFIRQQMSANDPNIYQFGLVGLRSGTKSASNTLVDRELENGKKARIHIGFLQSANDPNFTANIEEDINKSLQRTILKTAGAFGESIDATINPQTKDQILDGAVLSSAVGSVFESALQMIGAPYIDKIEAIKSMDFPFGLGDSAKLFGNFPSNIPTDATRTIAGSGKGVSDFLGQINRFVSAVDSGKFTDKLDPLPTSQALSAREMADSLIRASRSNPDNISRINDVLQRSSIPGIIRKQNSKRTEGLVDNLARSPETIKMLKDAGFGQASGGLIQKFKLGGPVYDLQKNTGLKDAEFNELVRYANTNDFSEKEFKDYLQQYLQNKAAKKDLRVNSEQLRQVLLGGTRTQSSSSKQMDLARSLMGSPDAKYDFKYDNARKSFAVGGTVPAMVSAGEAFVPPETAKKIGYGKLNRMNQADKNGMRGFSGGGNISVFKGPGSGTSDSIGPVGLPEGSFVIRAKATKALGLNKGGVVGVKTFAGGSPGGVSNNQTSIDLTPGLTKPFGLVKTAAIKLANSFKSSETLLNEAIKIFDDIGLTGTDLGNAIENYAGELIDAKKITNSQLNLMVKNYAAAIEGLRSSSLSDEEKAEAEKKLVAALNTAWRSLSNTPAAPLTSSSAKTEAVAQTSTKPIITTPDPAIIFGNNNTESTSSISPEISSRVKEIEKSTTKKYSSRYKSAPSMTLAGSNALNKEQVKLVAQAEYETAAMKAIVESMNLTADQRDQINKLQQDITNKYKDEYKSAADAADKAAVKAKAQIEFTTTARENLFGSTKPTVTKPETLPTINTKIAEERQQYLQMRAERAGMSVGGYRYSMAQKLGENQFNVRREMTLAREDTKSMAVGRSRELKGVNVSEALKEGNTSAEAQRVQGIIADFTNQLQKADPSLGAEEARQAAIELATGLSTGTKSVQEIVAANQTLNKTLNGTIDEAKVMGETFRRTSIEMGESVENLKANVSNKQLEQQAFIKSTEGQRFGALAEFAPGLTQSFAGTRTGKALGAGADFISGKGGRLSKAFAGAGGFTGIGAGIAGGAEALKQFLPKSATSDPNTAGALEALGGAGTGAAVGAQLGSLAGPIGTLIGGVGGAIIGGINGWFSGKNQAILTNALENIAKKSGDLEVAFKKLESDFSTTNLGNAQKAFGDVLQASTSVSNIALSDPASITGSATSGSAAGGAALGAAIGTAIAPGLGTAIGGVLGYGIGAYADYRSSPTAAERSEALGAMVSGSSQRNEAAARLVEFDSKNKSTEELGAIFDSLKNGTGELNPIIDQYVQGALKAAEAANGTKQLTAAQTESITTQAKEQAALDAYMKKRKEAGATDEQIGKELSKNRATALKEGQEAINAQALLVAKQNLLARTTKEVAKATENLLDVYRRVDAYAQKYSSQLDRVGEELDATIAGLNGGTGMRNVNRENEQVLSNVSAYSMDEVRAAAGATAGMLGGTPEAQNLANQAIGQKIVLDQIPNLLRNAKDSPGREEAIGQIRTLLEQQGIGGEGINTVLNDLSAKLDSGEGVTSADLNGVVEQSFSTIGKGSETLTNLAKKYNDTLQKAIDFQQKYNAAILESNNYIRKANQIRLNAELDLAKALGKTLSLDQLNQPFDAEVSSLTSGLVSSGDLAAESASDPASIANAIIAANQRNKELDAQSPQILAAGAGLAENDPLRNELNQAQMDNIRAMGQNTVAIAEGRQALEKLANDGSKAANALGKIQEQQQKIESMAGRFEKIFTASPEELFDMNRKSDALALAQTAGADQFKSRRFRQDAFAGLEQDKEFLKPEEYNKQRAMLLRKSFESQGLGGNSMINKGGINMTVDEFLKRVESGPSEDDPNVKAYREAVATQVAAQEALGKLSLEQAYTIQDAMLQLEGFLSTKFPDILTQAITDSRTDSETKPKTETKPKEPSQTQKDLATAKQDAKDKKDAEDQAKAKAKEAKKTASGPAQMMEAKRLENEARAKTREREAADATVVSLESKNKTEQETAKVEADKTAQEQAKKAESEKAAREAERRKNAADIVKRNEEIRRNRGSVDSRVEERFGSVRAAATIPSVPSAATATTSSQPKPTVSPSKETGLTTTQIPSLSRSEKANLAALARIPKEKRSDDQQARYTALANRNRATNPAIQAKQKAEAIKNEQQIAQAQAANFTTPVQFDETSLTLDQAAAGAATPAQRQIVAQAQVGAGQPQAVVDGRLPNTPENIQKQEAAKKELARLDAQSPVSSPVPVTRPQTGTYTSQVSSSPTGQNQPGSEMSANVITLDQASLDGLNSFNTNFAGYVDKLVNFEFPVIPEKIEMVGNHTVDVRITGAAAFEGLDKRFKEMINKAVDDKMGEIWKKTGGALGSSPGRPTK